MAFLYLFFCTSFSRIESFSGQSSSHHSLNVAHHVFLSQKRASSHLLSHPISLIFLFFSHIYLQMLGFSPCAWHSHLRPAAIFHRDRIIEPCASEALEVLATFCKEQNSKEKCNKTKTEIVTHRKKQQNTGITLNTTNVRGTNLTPVQSPPTGIETTNPINTMIIFQLVTLTTGMKHTEQYD